MAEIDIYINDQKVMVQQGSMIIEAADTLGISIPRFCYHPKLSVAANCRMCLVEVEKSPKPVPACATPAIPNMRIYTQSEKVVASQKAVMEFLLINHPLDCPICDQGGECELQDHSLTYGQDQSHFVEKKRVVQDVSIGPLIQTDLTRCIHCTRCVRFGKEIAGKQELGLMGRGEHAEIRTAVERTVQSELSGNVIDLCPVGALTSKPFRFRARAWEMTEHEGISCHDALGSHLYMHVRDHRIMRVVPRACESINEVWLSDRDRFGYLGTQHPKRLMEPMVKSHDLLIKSSIDEAIQTIQARFNSVLQTQGSSAVAILLSHQTSCEDAKAWLDWAAQMGIEQIDARYQASSIESMHFSCQSMTSLQDIESHDLIIVLGSELAHEYPLLAHRIRKAQKNGTHVIDIGMWGEPISSAFYRLAPEDFIRTIAAFTLEVAHIHHLQPPSHDFVTRQDMQAIVHSIAASAQSSKRILILTGRGSDLHPQASILFKHMAYLSHHLSHIQWIRLPSGTNSLALESMIPAPAWHPAKPAYLIAVDVSWRDLHPCSAYAHWMREVPTLYFGSFQDEIPSSAEVALPLASFGEYDGSYINLMGHQQSFNAAVPPAGLSKTSRDWLSYLLPSVSSKPSQTLYQSPQICVRTNDSIKPYLHTIDLSGLSIETQPLAPDGLWILADWPIYRIDSIVRHADALQASATQRALALYIHEQTASHFRLSDGCTCMLYQGQHTYRLPVIYASWVPLSCGWVPLSHPETMHLIPFASVRLQALN